MMWPAGFLLLIAIFNERNKHSLTAFFTFICRWNLGSINRWRVVVVVVVHLRIVIVFSNLGGLLGVFEGSGDGPVKYPIYSTLQISNGQQDALFMIGFSPLLPPLQRFAAKFRFLRQRRRRRRRRLNPAAAFSSSSFPWMDVNETEWYQGGGVKKGGKIWHDSWTETRWE